MFRRSERALLVVLLMATAPLLGACGSDEAPPPPAPASANSALAGSLNGAAAPASNTTPCADKQVRECRVELGRQGTVSNCFVGLQLCTGGSWSSCESASEIEAQLNGQ